MPSTAGKSALVGLSLKMGRAELARRWGQVLLFAIFLDANDFGQVGRASLPALLSANAPPVHWRNLF